MKKSIFLLLVVTVLLSCKLNDNHDADQDSHMNQDSTMMHNDSTMTDHDGRMMDETSDYSCPMHPEVKGTMNDKCSKCGMSLELANSNTK
jgi:hypothetical protein